MTYSGSARWQFIGPNRVEQEIIKHGHGRDTIEQFYAEFGERHEYDAGDVLAWLGY